MAERETYVERMTSSYLALARAADVMARDSPPKLRPFLRAAFVGSVESANEGIGVNLIALGLSAGDQVAFIVSDNYRNKLEVPDATLSERLKQLSESGALILSISETLASRERLEVVWTLPTEHPDPNNPQVLEMRRPAS